MNRKSRKVALVVIFLTTLLTITPLCAAVTRRTFLINYILSTEVEDNGFGNSYEETSHALEVLSDSGTISSLDTETLTSYLQDEIQNKFDDNKMNVYDLYYLLNSLDLLISTGDLVSSSLKNIIIYFLDTTNQTGGGFSPINTTGTPNVISTYYAIKAYNIIDNNKEINEIHKNWTLNCKNDIDGGFGGNSTLSSSLISTYYAISILELFQATGEIVSVSDTIDYLKSFYVSEVNDQDNYGGYLPYNNSNKALLSSSYYCIQSLNILSPEDLHNSPTCNWAYSLQNLKDGGFSDRSVGTEQLYSNIPCSYYAFKIITLLGGNLDVHIWMVEFNWIVLIIILSIIAFSIVIAIYLWRKRRI